MLPRSFASWLLCLTLAFASAMPASLLAQVIRPPVGGTSSGGDVIGPTSADVGELVMYGSTTGKLLTNSSTTITADSTLSGASNVLIPTALAVRTYVDGRVTGIQWKTSVRVATTGNGTLASAYENGDTVDGVALATNDRILLKNQTTATENGIYTVNASGAPTRATDADTGAEVLNATVLVTEGTANAFTTWTNNNTSTPTLGSTNITFAQMNGANVYTASTGLTLSGSAFAIDSTVATLTGSQTLTNKTLTSPLISTVIGGSAVGSSLVLKSTTAVGTTDYIDFQVGNNGATQGPRITHTGHLGVNNTTATGGWVTIAQNGAVPASSTALLYGPAAITGDAGGSSAGYTSLNLQTYIDVTNNSSPFATINNLLYGNVDYGKNSGGTLNTSTQGTSTNIGMHQNVWASGSNSNEHDVYYGGVSVNIGTGYAGSGTNGSSVFAVFDGNVQGPIEVQPGLLDVGVFFLNNYYNGQPSRSGQLSGGLWVLTKQGSGGELDATHTAAATYPNDVGVGVMGTASAGTGVGWNYAFKAGGKSGPFGGVITASKIGIGLDLSDYVTDGIYLHGRFSGATGPAIAVDTDAGDVIIGGTAATGRLDVAGTYATNPDFALLRGTLTSTTTSTHTGLKITPTFQPGGASLSQIYGELVSPTLGTASITVNQAFALSAGWNVATGFSGSVTTAAAFHTGDVTITGSGAHFGSYTQYLAQAIASNGSGKTTGTYSNFGFRCAAFTAAPGSGGTVNNTCMQAVVPTAAGAGTETNIGLKITGNGGGDTVYALYSDSTAPSLLLGPLDLTNATTFTAPIAAGYAPTAAGVYGYDSTAKVPVVGLNGVATGRLSTVLSAQYGGDTNNDNNGSAASDYAHTLTYAMPGNTLSVVGKRLRVTLTWKMVTGTSPTLTYKVKFGSTTLYSHSAVTPAGSQSNVVVTHIYDIICSTTGASGAVVTSVAGTTGAYANASTQTNITAQPVSSIDLTATQTLTYTSQWSADLTGTNSIQLLAALVELLG